MRTKRNIAALLKALVFAALIFPITGLCDTVVQAWSRRYGYEGMSVDDIGDKIAADSSGNVIVAGHCLRNDSVNLSGLVVIKYSSAGIPVWTNRFHGPGVAGGEDNVPAGLAVDGKGNVFVTVSSYNSFGQDINFITLGYSDAGVPLWTNTYNGAGNSSDVPTGIAVVGNTNVVVCGLSWSGSNYDYTLIAYSVQGASLWTNRYSTPQDGSGRNSLTGPATDTAGNIFITGGSWNGAYVDYATLAYSASGVPLWTNRYSRPEGGNASAKGIAVTENGNVVVTGATTSGTNGEITTISYSRLGVALWTNRFNTFPNGAFPLPQGIAADPGGTVFVTARSIDGTNVYTATVAYASAGTPLWTNSFGSPDTAAIATGLAADANGRAFVTGSSSNAASGNDYFTVAYSAAGTPLWTNTYNGPANGEDRANALAVDSSGNIFVTGYSSNNVANGYDLVTIAYSASGAPLWTSSLNEQGLGLNYAVALAVDATGSVFVTGYSSNRFSGYDYATVKYSSAGVPLWTNRYDGPGSRSDYAVAIGVGGSGSVFVTGYSADSNGVPGYATIGYSNSGFPLWTNRYNGAGNNQSYATGLVANLNGKIFVTGRSYNGTWNIGTVAYSEAGSALWTNQYGGFVSSDSEATSIAAQPAGIVAVAGFSNSGGTGYDYVTLAYSEDGVPLWTNRYSGTSGGEDRARAVAIDGNGRVFVTGFSVGGSSGKDYATIAYSSSGTPLWTNRYNGPLSSSVDTATAIAVDHTGNVIVTGGSSGLGALTAFATIVYSNQGLPLWTNRWNAPSGKDFATAVAVAVDASDNVIVAGNLTGNSAIIAYSKAGVPLWTNLFDMRPHADQILTGASLAVSPDGSIYLAGISNDPSSVGTAYDYRTVKYVTLPTGVSGSNLVTSLQIGSPGRNSNTVTFSGIPGNDYITQFAPTLPGPWFNLSTNIAGMDGFWQIIDSNATNSSGFYRSLNILE